LSCAVEKPVVLRAGVGMGIGEVGVVVVASAPIEVGSLIGKCGESRLETTCVRIGLVSHDRITRSEFIGIYQPAHTHRLSLGWVLSHSYS